MTRPARLAGVCCLALLALAGCGLKGDPQPPEPDRPAERVAAG